MARNLSWFEARALAMLEGKPVRRNAWRRWHTYRKSVFLWFSHSPGDPAATPPLEPYTPRVCTNADHTDADFVALDWTDEGWTPDGNGGEPPTPTPPPDPSPYPLPDPPIGHPPAGGDDGSGGTGGGGGAGGGGSGGGGSVGGGGGWGGPGNPPGPGGNNDPGTGGGGGSTGGGGGGTPPGDGEDDNKPPKPPGPDYTPIVSLTLAAPIDGPACFIYPPPTGDALVNVTLPAPEGGKLLVATISVSCFGQTQVGRTLGPGASQGFKFTGPLIPGAKITAFATASDGSGHTWTGQGSDDWEPACIIHGVTWSGRRDTSHTCPPKPEDGSPAVSSGYIKTETYTAVASYAFNPEPGRKGALKIDPPPGWEDQPNGHTVTTTLPGGETTEAEWFANPPGSITGTVGENEQVTDVVPKKLGIFPPEDGTPVTDTEGCTTQTTASESGPV